MKTQYVCLQMSKKDSYVYQTFSDIILALCWYYFYHMAFDPSVLCTLTVPSYQHWSGERLKFLSLEDKSSFLRTCGFCCSGSKSLTNTVSSLLMLTILDSLFFIYFFSVLSITQVDGKTGQIMKSINNKGNINEEEYFCSHPTQAWIYEDFERGKRKMWTYSRVIDFYKSPQLWIPKSGSTAQLKSSHIYCK